MCTCLEPEYTGDGRTCYGKYVSQTIMEAEIPYNFTNTNKTDPANYLGISPEIVVPKNHCPTGI